MGCGNHLYSTTFFKEGSIKQPERGWEGERETGGQGRWRRWRQTSDRGRESRTVFGSFLTDLPSSAGPRWVILAEFTVFFQERPVSSTGKNGRNKNTFPTVPDSNKANNLRLKDLMRKN